MIKLEQWYHDLAILRENLVSLQVYCDQGNESLRNSINGLIQEMDLNDFVLVAMDGKALREKHGESVDNSILMGVVRIRRELKQMLDHVTESAKKTLGKSIVVDGS